MPSASPPTPPGGEPFTDAQARRVVRALRRYLTESDVYVAAAGRDNEMHRTDMNGLGLIMDWQNVGEHATPGRLSSTLGLSAPATSAMLERLEKQGHVTRSVHPDDRRSVVVHVTEHALATGSRMFGPLGARFAEVLGARSEAELTLIASFLEDVSVATVAARQDITGR